MIYDVVKPLSFKQVIGHSGTEMNIIQEFRGGVCNTNKIIFFGNSGTGKTLRAQLLAKMLSCNCEECYCSLQTPACYNKYKSSEIFISCASTRLTDDFSKKLSFLFSTSPLYGAHRVIILDEVQEWKNQLPKLHLSLEKLLKKNIVVCTTDDPKALGIAFTSRFARIYCPPLKPAPLKKLLLRTRREFALQISREEIEKIVEESNGSAREALSLLQSRAKAEL